MDLAAAVRAHLEECGVLAPYGHVVVACSGGADSVALAHLLAAAHGADHGAPGVSTFTIAHLDHGLRPASAEDARFVERLAGRLGVPCVTARRPIGAVAAVAAAGGKGLEAAARDVRYAFLEETAHAVGAGAVVTAHHLDDQAETVLSRLLRGTGVEGLAGMRPVRRLGGVDLVRPLLPFRAAALRDYLRGLGETWREDETNRAGNLRARLRADVLPVLGESAGRDPAPLLARLAQNAATASEALREVGALGARYVVADADGLRIVPGFERLPRALQVQALRARLAARLDGPPSRAEIERLLARVADGGTEAVAGLHVRRSDDGVRIGLTRTERSPIEEASLAIDAAGVELPDGRRLTARRAPAANAAFLERIRRADGSMELVDSNALVTPLSVRSRRDGDRFRPLGADADARLTHYLQRRGVPAEERDRVPLVCDAHGIVWVAGHGIADRARVRTPTEELVVLSLD